MAATTNYAWGLPADGDSQANGKPWGDVYRAFLNDLDTKFKATNDGLSTVQTAVSGLQGSRVSPADLEAQAHTAFTTAGTTPNFTLTPTTALASYALFRRFNVKFHAAGTTGSNTLNVSGLGAKSLMQYAQDGSTLIPATVTSGLIADVEYNGTYFILLDPAPGALGTSWAVKKLVLSTTGSSNAVTWSADEIVLSDSNGNQILRRNLSYSAVPSLDTGSIAASNWYYVWALYNSSTGTDGWFVSLSPTAPTMGSWTHKALISALKTNTTPYYLPIQQRGRSVQYKAGVGSLTELPSIASGVLDNAACSVTGYIPTAIAGKGIFVLFSSGGQSFLSANATTSASSCPLGNTNPAYNWTWTVPLLLESTSVYVTGTTNTNVRVLGFDLNI